MSDTPILFSPLQIRGLTLPNRIAVSPMAQYSANNGYPVSHHLLHYGKFAQGKAGLIFVEATAVTRDGRITNQWLCTGDTNRSWRAQVEYAETVARQRPAG